MKSDILQEIEENMKVIQNLINRQIFNVGDARLFLKRYGNFARKIEQLTKSRDNWKDQYLKLKQGAKL